MIYRIIAFLLINFAGLALGGIFTGKGVPSDWYVNLNKAPWTPPGWVFGSAWTIIMICFAIYMAQAWKEVQNRNLLIGLFALSWILNFIWNPIFFHFHYTTLGMLVISSLLILIGLMLFLYYPVVKNWSILILPYLIWLLIATSLNGYVVLNN